MKVKNLLPIIVLLLISSLVCLFSACKEVEEQGNGKDVENFTSYCVTFNLGDDSFTVYSNNKTGKVDKPADPQRSGFTFAGWYTTVDSGNIFNFDSIIVEDTNIYARWDKNPNKIRFEGNGSISGTMPDMIVEGNTPTKLPLNNFFREGYDFIGWSDIANGSVKNKDGGWFYMEEGIVTLFACWQPKKYNVVIDNENGEDTQKIVATFGEFLPLLKMPIKIGYVFSGYYSQKDGNGDKYIDSSMQGCKKYLLANEEITLFAKWIEAKNIINFDGNGNTGGSTLCLSAKSHEEVYLPECGFTRIGYTFIGWNELSDLSGKTYKVGDKFEMPASSEPIVLYAEWVNNNYKIVLDDNFSGEYYEFEISYDVEIELRENTYIRYGYTFVAWNDKSDGSGNYYQDRQTIINLTEEANGIIRLFAIWKPVTVLVLFNKSGGKGGTSSANITFGTQFPLIAAPTKEGYIFGGYYAQENGNGNEYLDSQLVPIKVSDLGADGIEVYANWIPKENTLMLYPNGGVGDIISIETKTDEVINLYDYSFYKIGYTLIGWNTKDNGNGDFYSYDSNYVTIASNNIIKLYAVWVAKSVIVKFNGNGSTSGNNEDESGYCDNEITLPNCGYTRVGYKFIGWSRTKNGDDALLQPNASYKIEALDSGLIEFFAMWDVQYYTVNYLLNGGVNSAYNPVKYTYLSGDIVLDIPTKRGYEFVGWYEDEEFLSKVTAIPSGSFGDKTYVAQWNKITYKIFYILNGANVENPNIINEYDIETETFYLKDPKKPNYNFEGWAEGNVVEKGSTGNKTFTAQWSGVSYSITYVLDGGVNGDGNPGTYMSDSDQIVLKSPTKLGYVFTGWTCVDMGINTPTMPVKIEKNSSGDRTFVAHWDVIKYSISYDLNGGENSDKNPTDYDITDEILLSDPTKIGYNFDGWREGALVVQGSTGNLKFTAEWSPINYEISIIYDKSLELQSKVIKYNIESKDILISVDPSIDCGYSIQVGEEIESVVVSNKNGYILSGWYENDNEGDVISSYLITTGTIGDKTITAKWEIIMYTIEYDVEDDAVFEIENPNYYNIQSDTIELQRPTREGYIFVDWVDENMEAVKIIPSGSIGNIKLKAIWILDESASGSEPT